MNSTKTAGSPRLSKRMPYSERTDLEKVRSNWRKAQGLYKREEWSTVVLRSVTAVELAANYVIRKELSDKRNLEEHFVEHLMIWANGIRGKFEKIILPLLKKETAFEDELKKIKKKVEWINTERNSIAHSGQFKVEPTAKKVIEFSKEIIETMIAPYEPDFKLKE